MLKILIFSKEKFSDDFDGIGFGDEEAGGFGGGEDARQGIVVGNKATRGPLDAVDMADDFTDLRFPHRRALERFGIAAVTAHLADGVVVSEIEMRCRRRD